MTKGSDPRSKLRLRVRRPARYSAGGEFYRRKDVVMKTEVEPAGRPGKYLLGRVQVESGSKQLESKKPETDEEYEVEIMEVTESETEADNGRKYCDKEGARAEFPDLSNLGILKDGFFLKSKTSSGLKTSVIEDEVRKEMEAPMGRNEGCFPDFSYSDDRSDESEDRTKDGITGYLHDLVQCQKQDGCYDDDEFPCGLSDVSILKLLEDKGSSSDGYFGLSLKMTFEDAWEAAKLYYEDDLKSFESSLVGLKARMDALEKEVTEGQKSQDQVDYIDDAGTPLDFSFVTRDLFPDRPSPRTQ